MGPKGASKFFTDGSSGSTFVSGLNGGVRGIAFDPYGAYGYDMLVTTTSGTVYRVNSSGAASVLANVGAFPSQPEDGIFVTAGILKHIA